MKKKNRFIIIIGALLLLSLILIGVEFPAPLYSPGEIAKAHKDAACMDCHVPFGRVPSASCTAADCHDGARIGDKLAVVDLHERMAERDCLACHGDHMGAEARITHEFNHGESARNFDCADCHSSEGLRAHKDNRFGTICLGCHTVKDWKDVTFSHRRFDATACADCHTADLKGGTVHKKGDYGRDCNACHTTGDWKKVTFSHDRLSKKTSCTDCHSGPKDKLHSGAGTDCAKCHKTEAWKPATFDHIEYFPLTRDHKVECAKCHDSEPAAFDRYTCMNCHEHATNKIERKHRKEKVRGFFGDCLRCHRVKMEGRRYGTRKVDDSMVDD